MGTARIPVDDISRTACLVGLILQFLNLLLKPVDIHSLGPGSCSPILGIFAVLILQDT